MQVDLDGLQKQIAEKAANKASAEQADKEAADQAVAWDKELMRLQALADKTKRDYNQSVVRSASSSTLDTT